MKKIFLTSSVYHVAKHLAQGLDLSSHNSLAFITTAADVETGEKNWLVNDRQSLVDVGFKVFDYTIAGKTLQQLQEDLDEVDYLYLSGGNTYYLLQEAQKSGFISLVRKYVLEQGKTYISTSAGSIVAGPDTYPALRLEKLEQAPELVGFEGFGLVTFCILPHWGSRSFKDMYLNHRLDHIYKKDSVPLILLTDNQYIKVEGETLEIIDSMR